MWVWGASLRGELLSIPSAVFTFIERKPKQRALWWPSARREMQRIADVSPLLKAELDLPIAPLVFATDAMGSESESDHGGCGVRSS